MNLATPANAMPDSLKGLQILVVDDMQHMRASMRHMLRDLGSDDVDAAADGDEAIRMIAAKPYDVVLCDYNLGDGKDGQQVLEEARHRKALPVASAFVMVTAESHMPMVLGALEYQPDEYLVKPFVKGVLHQRLSRAVQRKRQLRPLGAALADGDNGRALALCDSLSQTDPKQAHELLRIKGELCLAIGDLDRAAAQFEKALAIRDFAWARFGLGRVRLQQGQFLEAQMIFEELLAGNRHYLEVYDWLARAHEAQDQAAAAQKALQAAVALSPKSVRRQRHLGEIALKNADAEAAALAFRSAIEQGRNSCFGSTSEYVQLAEVLIEQGSPAKALAVMRDGRKTFAGKPLEEVQLAAVQATAYHRQGSAAEARRALDEALAIRAGHADELPPAAVTSLARGCLALDKRDAGLDLLRTAVRNGHDDPEVLARAQALFKEFGAEQEGATMIEEARLEMVKLNNLGVELARTNRMAEAVAQFIKAADGLPFNRAVNLNAAKILLTHMRQNGRDGKYMFRLRQYIERARPEGAPSADYENVLKAYREFVAR
ncbi:MAG: response regulator [Gammaproteobacteria bacterium]|nr:response regulator [Gammaproteobacteria bacterium]